MLLHSLYPGRPEGKKKKADVIKEMCEELS